jgi:hypothetical protein
MENEFQLTDLRGYKVGRIGTEGGRGQLSEGVNRKRTKNKE